MAESTKVYIHFLYHDPAGPLTSSTTNMAVACKPDSSMPEHASSVAMPSVITCPLCLQSAIYKELEESMDGTSSADRAAAAHAKANPTPEQPGWKSPQAAHANQMNWT